jgi:hypothetical protein
MSVSASTISASFTQKAPAASSRGIGRKFVAARAIEQPPQHGEKPFVKLVDDAFDGATLKWSQRLRLLEEANTRKIRRGDALDVIGSTQRRREKQFKVTRPSKWRLFATHYAAFAAAYIALAMAWCAVCATH